MTHAELVARAGAWLKIQGCGIVFTELVTYAGEIPDAIGWRDMGANSYLVECKASRSDFLADRKKPFRTEGTLALGRYRYYLCPPGMIKPEELPPKWGLLYCHPKKVEVVCGKHPARYDDSMAFAHQPCHLREVRMMVSALNRLKVDMGARRFHERIHLSYTDRQAEIRAQGRELDPE